MEVKENHFLNFFPAFHFTVSKIFDRTKAQNVASSWPLYLWRTEVQHTLALSRSMTPINQCLQQTLSTSYRQTEEVVSCWDVLIHRVNVIKILTVWTRLETRVESTLGFWPVAYPDSQLRVQVFWCVTYTLPVCVFLTLSSVYSYIDICWVLKNI